MPLETCTSQQLVTAPVRNTNMIYTCVEGEKTMSANYGLENVTVIRCNTEDRQIINARNTYLT
jgi:DNA-binding transcriptional regulator LsrR (DeoR family)